MKEVELNRRLCADVYLSVVSIVKHKDGVLVGGRGKAMEYAVKMRRLPQEAMMEIIVRNVVIMYSRREMPSNPT